MAKRTLPLVIEARDPTSSDNLASGYEAGQMWMNSITAKLYRLINASAGTWDEIVLSGHGHNNSAGNMFEIGVGNIGAPAFLDIHVADDVQPDYSTRLLREGGANGALFIYNRGSGEVQISSELGTIGLVTNNVRRVGVDATGATIFGRLTLDTVLGEGGEIVWNNQVGAPSFTTDVQGGNFRIFTNEASETWVALFNTNASSRMNLSVEGMVIASQYTQSGTIGTNGLNARNHFMQWNVGTAPPQSGWIAAAFGDTTTNRVVIGQFSSKAVLGVHNGSLEAWGDLHINPENAGDVIIGSDISGYERLRVNGEIKCSVRIKITDVSGTSAGGISLYDTSLYRMGIGYLMLVADNGGDAVYWARHTTSGCTAIFGADAGSGLFGTISNHELGLRSNNTVRLRITDYGIHFAGSSPVVAPSLGAAATDLASVITLANNLRSLLINNGLGAA